MQVTGKITVFAAIALFTIVNIASAATVIEKDGFKYKIGGDWQIQLRQDPGIDQELDVEYDDLEIKNSLSYKIDDNLTAFGQLDFGFKNAADKDDAPHLEEAYVGLAIQDVSVSFGKMDNAADEFGVEAAYEEPIAEDIFDEFTTLDGDDMIKLDAKIADVVRVVVTHELPAESETSGNEEFTDICVAAGFSGLEVAAVYQVYEDDVLAPTIDATAYGVSASYDAKVVKVGADYSFAENDLDASDDQSFINAVVTVPVGKAKIAAGYQMLDYDDSTKTDVEAWYANVTYKLNKKVSAFAEIENTDEDDYDMGYMAGLRLKF